MRFPVRMLFPLLCLLVISTSDAAKRTVIKTPNAPAAIGPYSQAILMELKSGDKLLSAAGQIGLGPSTGKIVPGGIIPEAHQAMNNVQSIVQAASGFSMNDVTECTVLMVNLTEYSAFNNVYAKYFNSEPPARAAVEVVRLPMDARVEVKCSAAK
jgi:2-iminobutanoate/2-iminopropanoate deaminase